MRTQVALALLLLVELIYASHPVAPFALTSWSLSSSASFPQGRSKSLLREMSTSPSRFRDGITWYNATGPATVMAALQQSNTFNDPYYADNIKKINTSMFAVPWNYMTSFVLPAPMTDTVLLTFKGINYRAEVWLNGYHVANSSTIIGTFRYFDIDITNYVFAPPTTNTLVIQVTQPNDACFPPNNNSTDLAFTFVDWTYYPPDNSMGIWRDVIVSMVDGITVRYPAVTSTLAPGNDQAYLEVMAELTNWLSIPMQGLLIADIPGIGNFSQAVTLSPLQTLQAKFSNNTFAGLNVARPELWWPWQMGSQHMYNLTLTFIRDDTKSVSDEQTVPFGIRQVNSFINSNGSRQYQVNGQNILIRGAGWSPDLFLVYNDTRLITELSYVKWMGLNSVRLEGKMEPDNFFTFADQLGLLVLPGWCCCDAWQHWQYWGAEQYYVAQESLRSQVKRMRIHPSVLVFIYSSDELPPQNAEAVYLAVFKDEPWPAATLAAASAANSTLTGPTGVKMSGPYSWVPPVYWLGDHTGQLGGAYGFLTEGGPGENPLPFESLQRTVKNHSLWPSTGKEWSLHCGNPEGLFYDLRYFTPPLEARYGLAVSAQDYSYKSQLAAYEAHRAMFEAYSRNKYTSTGVIQWMLNNAWPQMIWHLYDNYLNPGGSFFGTLKACEPLHIMYSYYDNTVWIVNSAYSATGPLVATAAAYNIDSALLWQAQATVSSVASDGVMPLPTLTVPTLKNATTTYLLRLQIHESDTLVSTNVYWLSTQTDVLAWNQSNFYRTPCTQYADFTALQSLPAVSLNVSSSLSQNYAVVTIENPTDSIALAVRARLIGADGLDVAPVFWSDNYITLWPTDRARLIAAFDSSSTPTLVIETFNSASKA